MSEKREAEVGNEIEVHQKGRKFYCAAKIGAYFGRPHLLIIMFRIMKYKPSPVFGAPFRDIYLAIRFSRFH